MLNIGVLLNGAVRSGPPSAGWRNLVRCISSEDGGAVEYGPAKSCWQALTPATSFPSPACAADEPGWSQDGVSLADILGEGRRDRNPDGCGVAHRIRTGHQQYSLGYYPARARGDDGDDLDDQTLTDQVMRLDK